MKKRWVTDSTAFPRPTRVMAISMEELLGPTPPDAKPYWYLPKLMGCIGPEGWDDFRVHPEARARAHRVAEMLKGIAKEDKQRWVWMWAAAIMGMPFDDEARGKPLAAVVTKVAATAYEDLTGKRWTRTSKKVADRGGLKETGDFAKLLGKIFDIREIKASAAGQVKLLENERRTRSMETALGKKFP